MLIINIYRYTFSSTDAIIRSLPWKPPAISSTLEIPQLETSLAVELFFEGHAAGYKPDLIVQKALDTSEPMKEKPTLLAMLIGTWIFWFVLFLSIGA